MSDPQDIIMPAGVPDPRVQILKLGDRVRVSDVRDDKELDAEVILPSRFGPANKKQYTFSVIRVFEWGQTCDPMVLWVERQLLLGLQDLLEGEDFWSRVPIVKGELHDGYYIGGIAPGGAGPPKEAIINELGGFWVPRLKACFFTYQEWTARTTETTIDVDEAIKRGRMM